MTLLEHENQIFLDAFHEDGLLITARGLGMERIFQSFLKLYCDPGNLVLVLNTTSSEEEYFNENLKGTGTKPLPTVITTEYSVNDRKDLYLQGGVVFVTSRILVVDMLTDRIPIHLITGILVYKAHKIIDSCQEAFILRLYRQKNKKGFIKAFSDSPQSFTAGFCHVERVMKSLFVRKLFLWPRFHASVMSSLDKHKVDVVELYVELTPAMQACQTALLDLIDACVKEVKRGNTTLDTDELTVENAITKNFHKIVKLQLDPIWHQLSPKTKQLIADIKMLRSLLEYLTQYDCVNFYNLVNSIRSSEKQFSSNSGWLYLDSAENLFVHAKDRVLQLKSKKGQQSATKSEQTRKLVLEECPKWLALKEVLEEIEGENERMKEECGDTGAVLVVAQDDRTCNQIKEFLCEGGKSLLQRLYDKTIKLKAAAREGSPVKNKFKGKWKGRGQHQKEPNSVTLTEIIDTHDSDEEDGAKKMKLGGSAASDLSVELSDSYVGVLKSPVTILHPLHGSSDTFSLQRALQEVQPRFVVMYDTDMQFVRQLEVFRASRPGKPLRAYFLIYSNSTEEQKYLTSLRKEKEAFEYLIRQKATMVIPEEREGKAEDDPELSRDVTPANRTVNSRKGDQNKQKDVVQKVIVDMREFRSELPSLIHRRGIDIEPVTIEVGDYILTPDICVERKSVSDLIGSLNNGRLYNQSEAMCRFYRRPVLLIEFDPNKSFALQGQHSLREDISSSDISSRLALLTIHFPRLRLFWCQSPYATAELCEEIKVGRDQPSAEQAMALTDDTEEDLTSGKYSHGPQTLLLKMPGINSKNVNSVMNKVESIAELVTLSVTELTDILKSEANAKRLHTFLHKDHSKTAAAAASGSGATLGDGRPSKPGKPAASKVLAAAAARQAKTSKFERGAKRKR